MPCIELCAGKERKVAQSCPTLCDLWTVAYQAPPSTEFSKQEYWRGLPFPSPRGSSQPTSPALQADALPSEPPSQVLCTGDTAKAKALESPHSRTYMRERSRIAHA